MKATVNKSSQVKFLMRAGKDIVESATLPENVERMIAEAQSVERSDEFPDYPIYVNGTFFFPDMKEEKPEEKPKRKKR